jgi:arylsulfatase A-like enzyme
MGKQNLYEHVKPPLIIAGPGIPHGQSNALVYLYDLFPTICDLAKCSQPSVVEGKSLMPVVRGESNELRPYLFTAYRSCQRMVRDKRWKLIEYAVGMKRHTQLFDLTADPDELHNLVDEPSQQAMLHRLRQEMMNLGKGFGDPSLAAFVTDKTPSSK